MPTREDLHKLIDSLPKEAIEAVYKVLSHFQVWPPPLPPQIEDLRQAYEKRMKGGPFDHVDGDTLVVETRRYQDGHELAIVERIRIQDGQMNFKHEVTGPRGKRPGRPPTAASNAKQVRRLLRAGISKAAIALKLRIGRTSVRRILATRTSQ